MIILDPTAAHAGMAKSTSKPRHYHQLLRGTFAPNLPVSPQLLPGSATLSNIIVVQHIGIHHGVCRPYAHDHVTQRPSRAWGG